MTLYLLKVHLQTFLSIPITQKCQILSCDILVANKRYVLHCQQQRLSLDDNSTYLVPSQFSQILSQATMFRHMLLVHSSELVQILMNAALLRQCQALLFQEATVHSLRITSRHVAAPQKYSVSQHGSQANVLQTSMSSMTVNKLSMPVQKISPTTHSNASSTHTDIPKICKCLFTEVTQKYAYPFIRK